MTSSLNIKDDRGSVFATPSTCSSFFPPVYKIMIIGKCGVGKTSLLWRFLYKEFKEDLRGTIIDKETKRVNVRDMHIDLELWDTARLEAHYTLSPQYLRDANGVIIVYEITDPTSFVEVKDSWLRMVFTQFGEDADTEIPILLVGSKSDLVDRYDESQTNVKAKDVREDLRMRHNHLLGPIECSSKTGKNVEMVFKEMAEVIIQRDMEGSTTRIKNPVKVKTVTDTQCCS